MSEKIEAEGGAMTPLDPRQKTVLRIRLAFAAAVLIAAAFAADIGPLRETPLRQGLVPGVVALLALIGLLILPGRRYRAWGYREEAEELHIRHGLFVRMLTALPFARVQHIDLAQGPIERRFGLARLILHTAGTRGAAIPLPGLAQVEAERLRDAIRAKMRQDLL